MRDKFNREITYLRISITDKCNLRCTYCMPEDGVELQSHSDFLSFEQIEKVVKSAARLGIRKIRLTGGEPLIKNGIVNLVKMISAVDDITEIGMTTNGILLPKFAKDLKNAGLSNLNISCDTLDEIKYRNYTRGGVLNDVLNGIEAARNEDFPIKLNMVVQTGTSKNEILQMQKFCDEKKIKLQLINHYSLLTEKQDYTFDRPPKCAICNRIRLLADGNLKPCLHSENEVKIDFDNIEKSLRKAILEKPKSGKICTKRKMFEIGG